MDAQIRKTLTETLLVAERAAAAPVDDYGAGAYDPVRGLPCRLVERTEKVRDRDGEEVVSRHQAILDDAVSVTARVWLPGEDPATRPGRDPIAVAHRRGERGEHDHYKVWL